MNTIENIYEPTRLFLVWRHSRDDTPRNRRIIGVLIRLDGNAVFRYLKGTDDFKAAIDEGFLQFPAFPMQGKEDIYHAGALDVFRRRLPPRKREDFAEYLAQYNLPPDFAGSDFALLSYTGAKLASDNFELCPDLSDAAAPLDLVIEVAGTQHHVQDVSMYSEGDPVSLELEEDNIHDQNAVKVICRGQKIGYVNRAYAAGIARFVREKRVEANICKVSLYKEKPRFLVLVRYS